MRRSIVNINDILQIILATRNTGKESVNRKSVEKLKVVKTVVEEGY